MIERGALISILLKAGVHEGDSYQCSRDDERAIMDLSLALRKMDIVTR
jgi:hypothetical protein